MDNSIGNKIKQLRLNKSWTQEYVSKYLGVTSAALSAYESNKRQLSMKKISLLALLFEVTVDYFDNSTSEVETKQNELIEELRATMDFLKKQIESMNDQNQHLRELLELALKGNFPGGSELISTALKNSDFTPLKLVA